MRPLGGNLVILNDDVFDFTEEFKEYERLAAQLLPRLKANMLLAGREVCSTISQRGTIFIAGNGGSASQADHLAAEFVGRFKVERAPYPAMSLATSSACMTAIANDYAFEEVFSRQLRAHASGSDLVIALTTSGTSPNIIRLLLEAQALGLRSIVLTGMHLEMVQPISTVTMSVPSRSTAHVQEVHLFLGHLLASIGESCIRNAE